MKRVKTVWNYRSHPLPAAFSDAAHRRVEAKLQAEGRRSPISVMEASLSLRFQFVTVILWIFYEVMPLPQSSNGSVLVEVSTEYAIKSHRKMVPLYPRVNSL